MPVRKDRLVDTDLPTAQAEPSLQAVEHELLGGERRYTRAQVAELAHVDTELASTLWRALGFADVSDYEVAFSERDIEALRTFRSLVNSGVLDEEAQLSVAR